MNKTIWFLTIACILNTSYRFSKAAQNEVSSVEFIDEEGYFTRAYRLCELIQKSAQQKMYQIYIQMGAKADLFMVIIEYREVMRSLLGLKNFTPSQLMIVNEALEREIELFLKNADYAYHAGEENLFLEAGVASASKRKRLNEPQE